MKHNLLIKLVILALFLSPLASAQPSRGGSGADSGYPRGQADGSGQPGSGAVQGNNLAPPQIDAAPAVTRQQALDLARNRFQGRILSVRMVGNDWRIRVDQNGTVFNVFVDGRTGELSRAAE